MQLDTFRFISYSNLGEKSVAHLDHVRVEHPPAHRWSLRIPGPSAQGRLGKTCLGIHRVSLSLPVEDRNKKGKDKKDGSYTEQIIMVYMVVLGFQPTFIGLLNLFGPISKKGWSMLGTWFCERWTGLRVRRGP